MINTIELEKRISVQSVVKQIRMADREFGPLMRNNGGYGKYQYMGTVDRDKCFIIDVLLDFIVPSYGGMRYFLVCRNCERRVMHLYLVNPYMQAYCRHCLKLEYASRQFRPGTLFRAFSHTYRAGYYWHRRHRYGGKLTRAGRQLAKYNASLKKSIDQGFAQNRD
ncbi:hypothetical protein KC968_03350 [Candidatus Saccharibacteria bacterium]|nr:hypothetical protein [Candidatus Saccharibacteria bacterium]